MRRVALLLQVKTVSVSLKACLASCFSRFAVIIELGGSGMERRALCEILVDHTVRNCLISVCTSRRTGIIARFTYLPLIDSLVEMKIS